MREVGLALMTLGLQSLDVAVRADLVREVLGAQPWVALPGTRPGVPGVVVWSGRAVAAVDMAHFDRRLTPLREGERRARTVILAVADCTLAMAVDRVSEVWKTHEDAIHSLQLADFELARFEVLLQERALPLLEPQVLLSRLGIEA